MAKEASLKSIIVPVGAGLWFGVKLKEQRKRSSQAAFDGGFFLRNRPEIYSMHTRSGREVSRM
jgi:hypothetical protein